MISVRVRPESFTYFHNSKTYYLNGITLEPILDENFIILPKGSFIQLLFDSSILNKINLAESKELLTTVESFAREVFSRGRKVLRFTVTNIDENDKRKSD